MKPFKCTATNRQNRRRQRKIRFPAQACWGVVGGFENLDFTDALMALAISLVEDGKRVHIIDADPHQTLLRKVKLHQTSGRRYSFTVGRQGVRDRRTFTLVHLSSDLLLLQHWLMLLEGVWVAYRNLPSQPTPYQHHLVRVLEFKFPDFRHLRT